MKTCSKCGLLKPPADMCKDKRRSDGLSSWCKACLRAATAAYRSREPEKMHNARMSWRSRNRTRESAKSAEYVANNRKRVAAWSRARRARDPLRYRVIDLRSKAKRAAAGGSHTKADIERLFARQRGRCVYCPMKLARFHVDHIKPLARGGSNDPTNLQLLCANCNLRKGAKDPIKFAQERGLLL